MKETPKTIRFRRYAPLKLTKRIAKKTISKKEMKKMTDLLVKNVAKSIDDEVMGMLKAGSAKNYTGTSNLVYNFGDIKIKATRWDRIRWRIRDIVSGIRVAIAEWVGGDDLHSNCGEYHSCHKLLKPQEDVREKVKKQISEFYFIHCKPKTRPEFKKVDEAQSWMNRHQFQIEQLVGKTTDSILAIVKGE